MAVIVSPKWKKYYDRELAAGRITKSQWTYAVTGEKPKVYSTKAPNDPDDKPKTTKPSGSGGSSSAPSKPHADLTAAKAKDKARRKRQDSLPPLPAFLDLFDLKTPSGKVVNPLRDSGFSPTPPRVSAKLQKPPPRTDWRWVPGGGYVDIKHPKSKPVDEFHGDPEDVALARHILDSNQYTDESEHQARKYLNAVAAARKAQIHSFKAVDAAEAKRKSDDALNKMRVRWAAEAHKKFGPYFDWQRSKDEGFFEGARKAYRVWDAIANTVGGGIEAVADYGAHRPVAQIPKDYERAYKAVAQAGMELPAVLGTNVGLPEAQAEKWNRIWRGDAQQSKDAAKVLHASLGSLAEPGFQAMDPVNAALMLVGTAASPFKLAGATARAAFRARNVERSIEARVLVPHLDVLGSEGGLVPLQPHTNIISGPGEDEFRVFDALVAEMETSKERLRLTNAMSLQLPRRIVSAMIQMVDAQALRVHQELSAAIPHEIARLDEKVAAGTATEADLALRKDLGFMQRYGVPVDYFYKRLDDAGTGIPEIVQEYFRKKNPRLNWNFKFDRPRMTGPTYSEEAVAGRLRAKLNPANADKGFPVNPKVFAKSGRFKGIQVAGPIDDADWLRRLKKVMPSKAERTYWANWYQSFEPLFRQAFGEDADAIMRGFAASQANTSPKGGVGIVLKVMDRIRRGEEVTNDGLGMVAEAVETAIHNLGMEEGMAAKLNDFTDALAQKSTRTWMGDLAEGGAPAPSDIWAGRDAGHVDGPMAGYLEREFGLKRGEDFVIDNTGKIEGHVYERVSEQYVRIAEKLNKMNKGKGFDGHQWTPADVQAVGWGSIQKLLGVTPEDITMALEGNAWEIATEVTKGVTGIGADLTIEQAGHVARMFEDDLRVLINDHPGVYLLPGSDFKFTTGGWSGGQNGAIQFKLIGAPRDIQDFITRVAHAFDQEYVQASRYTSSAASKPKSALIISSPKFKNEATKQRFFDALHAASPESKNGATKKVEKELQGYMAGADVEGNPSIHLRTHRASATGKERQPFIDRYKDAVREAEKATGIKVKVGQENMALLVGSQHGAEDALASAAGKAGGRGGVDDNVAAGIRAKLEPAVAGVRAGGAEAEHGVLASRNPWVVHGVHVRNLGRGVVADGLDLPAGMSQIHVSDNTLLPTRTWAHELSHYLDTQVLGRFNAAGTADPLLVNLSAKDRAVVEKYLGSDDPEKFAQAWEEWVLGAGERDPNVPEELKPALKELSDFIKKETQDAYWKGYRGRATQERVPLPPEIIDLFDSLHWYEGVTGKQFTPGVTKPEQVLRDLTEHDELFGSIDEGMEAGDAAQATRLLRYLDRNQPFTEAHKTFGSKGWNAAVEKFADKVSVALMGEGHVASAARRLMPTASAAMRVPKEAGRRLHQEAQQALGILHPAYKHLPKEEGGVIDTAHYWWAQMSEGSRDLDGLRAVRDRMDEELKALQDGSLLEEAQTRLAAVQDEIDELKLADPDAHPGELLKERGQIKGLITDMPHRAEDLTRALGQLDIAILAKPEVDPKIIDAIRTISKQRRDILHELGVLDEGTADVREGLVMRWLDREPDGTEIFIGHRSGKIRGGQSVLPNRIGLGRPRKPQGVKQENKLILANSGRLRASTHVAFEDWQAANAYRSSLRARHELSQMGVPYPGGRIPEGKVLVNPEGKLVPHHAKSEPLAGVSEETEAQIDARAKEMLDDWFASDPEKMDAMIAAVEADGIDLSTLRLVDEKVAKRYFAQFTKAKPSNKGGSVYDEAVNFMSASLIFARLGYIPKNVVQNLTMAVPHQGPMFLVNAPRAAQLMADEELRAVARTQIGSGATGALDKEIAGVKRVARFTHRLAGKMTAVADDPIRMSAWIHELAKEGVIPKLSPVIRPEDKAAILDFVRNGGQRSHNVMQRTRDVMGDFDRMTAEQRKWARRFLIIPGWLLAGSRYPVHFAITHPARSTAIAYALAGEPGADKLGLPQNRPITDFMTTKGFNTGIDLGDNLMERTTSLNPIGTPWEIAQSLIPGGKEPVGGYMNPLIESAYNLVKRKDRYGNDTDSWLESAQGNVLDALVPNYSFIEGMVRPKASGTYPDDKTRIGRLLREAGIFPIHVIAGGNAAKRAVDEWKDKVKAAKEAGVRLPPNWQAAVKSKGDWQAVQSQLSDDATEEDKARAKFELLKIYNPAAYKEKKERAYAAFADPLRVGSADYYTEKLLGWENLSIMSGFTNAKARKEAHDGLAQSTAP